MRDAKEWARAGGAAVVAVLLSSLVARPHAQAGDEGPGSRAAPTRVSETPRPFVATAGSVVLDFDRASLRALSWRLAGTETLPAAREDHASRLTVAGGSTVWLGFSDGGFTGRVAATLRTTGGLLIDAAGRRVPIGSVTVVASPGFPWEIRSGIPGDGGETAGFEATDMLVELSPRGDTLSAAGALRLSPATAATLGYPGREDWIIGTLQLRVSLARYGDGAATATTGEVESGSASGSSLAGAIGPDVIVGDIHATKRWSRINEITSYSIGTVACNVGDASLLWVNNTPQHPVIAQNVYRLLDGRFEQIGLSWVKHGFTVSRGTVCSGPGACVPDSSAQAVGPGCSDTYAANLNGFQANLGPRGDINAATGAFPYPFSAPTITTELDRRIQIRDEDLLLLFNAGARYFVEAHYVHPGDAAAGNQDNNASYREVEVLSGGADVYSLSFTAAGTTRREKAAILAWQEVDPNVAVEYVDVPGDRRFILAYRVTQVDVGRWHYEYAVQNLNSHRSARAFHVPLPAAVDILDIGFHDVHDHSGAPFDSADWVSTHSGDSLTWATQTFDENPDANALRWGSLYNFRFDADTCPALGNVRLELFRPGAGGSPDEMSVSALVPSPAAVLASSDPPDGAIDARQPTDLAGFNPAGWQSVDVTFSAVSSCTPLSPADFQVTQLGRPGPAPSVQNVVPRGGGRYTLTLDRAISDRAWTVIAHTPSNARVRLGYLPADVNADGVSNARDVIAIINALNMVGPVPPVWSADINRIKGFESADIQRTVDLLRGAGAFDPYNGAKLPPRP
ncbi:MAG: hypothetical protein HY763_07335 [Planctomycetes bacterium]|nr:hypothetical protein [Planctomycetota bacterium]